MTIRKNASLSVLSQGITLGLSLVSAVIAARWLGPAGKGLLSMTSSGGAVGATFLSFGVATGVSTLVARRSLSVRGAARVSAMAVTAALLVSYALLVVVLPVLPAERVVVARWLPPAVGVILLSMLQMGTAVGAGRLRASLANASVAGSLQLMGYVVAAQSGAASVETALAVLVFAQGAGAVSGWVLLLRGDHSSFGLARPLFREMMRLSIAAFPGLLLGLANFRLDIFLLGLWSSAPEVGRYSMAAMAVSALSIGPAALGHALMSRFGASEADSRAYLRKGMLLGVAIAAGLGLLAVPVAWVLVPRILGPGYSGTTIMLVALVPGFVLFSGCHVSSGYINVVLGRPWMNGRVSAASLAVDLVLLAILAPTMGGIGAAIASSVAYAVGAGLNLYQLRGELAGARASSGQPTGTAGDHSSSHRGTP